jgi:regulator of sirC expression with transglutaminase-like and TPR domain
VLLRAGLSAPPFFCAILLAVIQPRLLDSFARAALSPDPGLAVAALIIARVEHPTLDAGPYLDRLDVLGCEARRRLAMAPVLPGDAPPNVDPHDYARVMALNEYLFGELRFVGNVVQYEDPRNSFLNDVLDRRTGIPITLALLYMEVARRAGLHVEGINFPGHFLLRCPAAGTVPHARDLIIDAYHGGKLLSREILRRQARSAEEDRDPDEDPLALESRLLVHATKPQILTRMLLNLKLVYVNMRSFPQARDVTELLVAVDPSAINELRDRGLLAYHLKDFSAALRDLKAYLQLSSGSIASDDDREEQAQIWEHVKTLHKRVASLN